MDNIYEELNKPKYDDSNSVTLLGKTFPLYTRVYLVYTTITTIKAVLLTEDFSNILQLQYVRKDVEEYNHDIVEYTIIENINRAPSRFTRGFIHRQGYYFDVLNKLLIEADNHRRKLIESGLPSYYSDDEISPPKTEEQAKTYQEYALTYKYFSAKFLKVLGTYLNISEMKPTPDNNTVFKHPTIRDCQLTYVSSDVIKISLNGSSEYIFAGSYNGGSLFPIIENEFIKNSLVIRYTGLPGKEKVRVNLKDLGIKLQVLLGDLGITADKSGGFKLRLPPLTVYVSPSNKHVTFMLDSGKTVLGYGNVRGRSNYPYDLILPLAEELNRRGDDSRTR